MEKGKINTTTHEEQRNKQEITTHKQLSLLNTMSKL